MIKYYFYVQYQSDVENNVFFQCTKEEFNDWFSNAIYVFDKFDNDYDSFRFKLDYYDCYDLRKIPLYLFIEVHYGKN